MTSGSSRAPRSKKRVATCAGHATVRKTRTPRSARRKSVAAWVSRSRSRSLRRALRSEVGVATPGSIVINIVSQDDKPAKT
jgi:hypothetical protein